MSNDFFLSIVPLIFLLGFGYALRKLHYFNDLEIQKFNSFVGDILIPCVIFNTILNLRISAEYLALSIAFFLFLVFLLLASFAIYRLFHIKRKFFIFFHSAFAFGLMGIPLFSTVFGSKNMDYLVAMGVGHELFIAILYIPVAKMVLKGDPLDAKSILRNLRSPLFCMVLAALVLNLSGLHGLLENTVLGSCLFATIAKIASITTVLTMIVVGYRIHFRNCSRLRESICYVLFRYAFTFLTGYALKFLVLDYLVAPSPYFDAAFFIMLSQFGSTMLLMLVGKYCSTEDMEVSSNAFVINVLVGILLFIIFVGQFHPAGIPA